MALYGIATTGLPAHETAFGLAVTVHSRCSGCGHMLGVSFRMFLFSRMFRIDMYFGKTDPRYLVTLGLEPPPFHVELHNHEEKDNES